jgi:hypothetical protein
MIQPPGTKIAFFPVDSTTAIPATIKFATGHRNDPNADDPNTPVIAELLVAERPAGCEEYSAKAPNGWVIFGIPRAESAEAYAKLDPDLQQRGWWRPTVNTVHVGPGEVGIRTSAGGGVHVEHMVVSGAGAVGIDMDDD